jgi:hypothetical protein
MSATALCFLTASLCSSTGAFHHAVAVPGYSWANRPAAWVTAPACLVRAEVWQIGAEGLLGGLSGEGEWYDRGGGGLYGAGPLGGLYGGAGVEVAAGGFDTLSVSAGGAWLVTGDPISFMEGFFGPSVSLGAGLEAKTISRGGDRAGELMAFGSAQVALFPTFCIGVGTDGAGLAGWGEEDLRADDGGVDVAASCTYIFGRELRGHLGFGSGGPSVGADLRLSQVLTLIAGTDGGFWGWGLSARAGRVTADYGMRLTDTSASHSAGIRIELGEASW